MRAEKGCSNVDDTRGRRRRGQRGRARGTAGRGATGEHAPEFDPQDVTGTILVDVPEPTFRIDNRNATAAEVLVQSTGATDGSVYTVGAHQASYDPPSGKYVSVECGEVVTGLLARRAQDSEWLDSGFTGTATAPACTDG